MPTYVYKCEKCLHSFEQFLPMSSCDEPVKNPCPECHEQSCVQRCVTTPGVVIGKSRGPIGRRTPTAKGAPAAMMDRNMRADGKAKGGFKDVMQKICESPAVRGSKLEKKLRNRYGC